MTNTPDTSSFTGETLINEDAPKGWEHIETVTDRVASWNTYQHVYYLHKETGQYFRGEIAIGNTEMQPHMFVDINGDRVELDYCGEDKPARMTPVTLEKIWERANKWVIADGKKHTTENHNQLDLKTLTREIHKLVLIRDAAYAENFEILEEVNDPGYDDLPNHPAAKDLVEQVIAWMKKHGHRPYITMDEEAVDADWVNWAFGIRQTFDVLDLLEAWYLASIKKTLTQHLEPTND